MTQWTKTPLLWVGFWAGCGQPSTVDATFNAAVEWPKTAAACDGLDGLEIKAELWIGGHDPCTLTITDYVASGDCKEILPGIDRPLVIYYYLDNEPRNHALLLCVGFVDLRPEALPANASESVNITMCEDADGLIYAEETVSGLPEYDEEEADPAARARMYAREIYYYKLGGVLDSDDDGCPNLVEACDGTLETASRVDC